MQRGGPGTSPILAGPARDRRHCPLTNACGDPREDILQAYALYIERRRGLAPMSMMRHLWLFRPFLEELARNAVARPSGPEATHT